MNSFNNDTNEFSHPFKEEQTFQRCDTHIIHFASGYLQLLQIYQPCKLIRQITSHYNDTPLFPTIIAAKQNILSTLTKDPSRQKTELQLQPNGCFSASKTFPLPPPSMSCKHQDAYWPAYQPDSWHLNSLWKCTTQHSTSPDLSALFDINPTIYLQKSILH